MSRDWKREPREPESTMPKSMVLQAHHGVGKSRIAADLTVSFAPGDSQVLTLGDEDGMANLVVNEERIPNYLEFVKYVDALIEDKPYKFVIFDNLTVLDKWAETAGTLAYMGSSQGKSFNFKGVGRGPGFSMKTASQYFLPKDAEFESVYSLPSGSGYLWGRNMLDSWLQKTRKCADHVLYLGHIRINRFTNDVGNTVVSSNLNMTAGNIRVMSAYVDVMATMYRKKNKGFLSFKSGTDDYDAKCRYDYLDEKEILISEKNEEGLITNWGEIYPDYKNK